MKPPHASDHDRAAARDARRAEALRANLRRRKAVDPGPGDERPPGPEPAGEGPSDRSEI